MVCSVPPDIRSCGPAACCCLLPLQKQYCRIELENLTRLLHDAAWPLSSFSPVCLLSAAPQCVPAQPRSQVESVHCTLRLTRRACRLQRRRKLKCDRIALSSSAQCGMLSGLSFISRRCILYPALICTVSHLLPLSRNVPVSAQNSDLYVCRLSRGTARQQWQNGRGSVESERFRGMILRRGGG